MGIIPFRSLGNKNSGVEMNFKLAWLVLIGQLSLKETATDGRVAVRSFTRRKPSPEKAIKRMWLRRLPEPELCCTEEEWVDIFEVWPM